MRGHPALQSVIVLLLLGAAVYPVLRLVRAHDRAHDLFQVEAPIPSSTETSSTLFGTLSVTASPEPITMTVTAGGKQVMGLRDATSPGIYSRELSLSHGQDLLVTATWSDDRPHALRIALDPTGTNTPVSRDCWAGRQLQDTLSLP